MRIISPSILSANFGNLQSEVQMLNESSAEWIHLDIMDGLFVPNISFGFPVIESIRKMTSKVLDTHLMIVNPERYVERFAAAGADIIVYHYEATEEHEPTIELIKKCGAKAGISIKPNTPTEVLEPLLPLLDLVLVMGVEPGFSGQAYIENTAQRVQEIKAMKEQGGHNFIIEVDGGVSIKNAKELYDAGAEVLVTGSSAFSTPDPKAAIDELLNA